METVILICSGLVAIGGAIGAIAKWIVKPIQEITNSMNEIKKVKEGQALLMKSTASILQHIISGNHIERLEEDYEKLINFNIEN